VRWPSRTRRAKTSRRVLVAFAGEDLDPVVLQAAFRIARAEDATLVAAYLIVVPLNYPIDSPLVDQVGIALPILEAIEREAHHAGVPIDTRVERGRSLRDAITQLWAVEHFDRVILPATAGGRNGFDERDLAWILTHAPAETLVLRPAPVPA
jgi:nucleotide-binding universal stress UspA family protein